ncbi:S1C family serine protease [Neobacillus sp. 179-C4.2 HS]|uniref:S1C family serine protease n=1 Tax=Neobacillus driksii TaxID=3035913 RepID=A0ABV4YNN4_9BACI|nr:S1C family serine protease [Neobacillus sp. 179.-C4.2 HS]MDP5193754.1 S1C family serine protease [Neobacillus sp. 179.-C4.2 HS]
MNYKDEFERETDKTIDPTPDETANVQENNSEGQTFVQHNREGENESVFFANGRENKGFKEPVVEKSEEPILEQSLSEQSTNRVEYKNSAKKKKRKIKGFASMVAAGVVGSVLTLTVLPYTDYLENFSSNVEGQSIGPVQQNTNTKANTVTAQPTSAKSSSSIADTVEQLSKTIVGIVNYQQQQSRGLYGNNSSQTVESGTGSGVIFQKNNDIAYIVTNNHVVEGATKLEVSLYNGEKVSAEIVGTDALTDLAVIKIDSKYVEATAQFGDSSTLRPGDQVYAIGNPLGLDFARTVTSGIVSAVNRSIDVSTSAGNWETNVIQTDAAINPGNSGGALINPEGLVIGINSLKIADSGVEGLGFAIPSNDFIPIVNQLIESGKVVRPYLGIGLADLSEVPQMYWENLPESVEDGVMITAVEPNSAAANGGLEAQDVIVSMNGTKIANSSELRKYLYSDVKNGDDIKFEVYRDGKLTTVNVKLTK